jgi:hypothetical protein
MLSDKVTLSNLAAITAALHRAVLLVQHLLQHLLVLLVQHFLLVLCSTAALLHLQRQRDDHAAAASVAAQGNSAAKQH